MEMMENHKPIILIGYMGAGKTTLGKALADRLGHMFYDLDWYIENRMHRTVQQLFDERGEEGFRLVEHNMLHEVAEFEDVVLSCGGGTPCYFDNMDYMNSRGTTVYLKASADVLFNHLHMGRSVRPLLVGKSEEELMEFITEQLKKREPFYNKAKKIFNVSLLDNRHKIDESVDRMIELLNETDYNN